jgi:hypothetical protein
VPENPYGIGLFSSGKDRPGPPHKIRIPLGLQTPRAPRSLAPRMQLETTAEDNAVPVFLIGGAAKLFDFEEKKYANHNVQQRG